MRQGNHPHLTTAKAFYMEISRARDRVELSPAMLETEIEPVPTCDNV